MFDSHDNEKSLSKERTASNIEDIVHGPPITMQTGTQNSLTDPNEDISHEIEEAMLEWSSIESDLDTSVSTIEREEECSDEECGLTVVGIHYFSLQLLLN